MSVEALALLSIALACLSVGMWIGSRHRHRRSFVVGFTFTHAAGKTVRTSAIHGGPAMTELPAIRLFNTQKQPMDLNPVPPGGGPVDETVTATVTSSDPAQVGVEVDPATPGGYFLTTPLESGAARISITADGFEELQFDVSYSPFVAGQFNPVFGAPVLDA